MTRVGIRGRGPEGRARGTGRGAWAPGVKATQEEITGLPSASGTTSTEPFPIRNTPTPRPTHRPGYVWGSEGVPTARCQGRQRAGPYNTCH